MQESQREWCLQGPRGLSWSPWKAGPGPAGHRTGQAAKQRKKGLRQMGRVRGPADEETTAKPPHLTEATALRVRQAQHNPRRANQESRLGPARPKLPETSGQEEDSDAAREKAESVRRHSRPKRGLPPARLRGGLWPTAVQPMCAVPVTRWHPPRLGSGQARQAAHPRTPANPPRSLCSPLL